MIFTIYKERGETPLECLERFRAKNPTLAAEKMTYAGRLDPLAEGVLIILTGEDCKNKEQIIQLDKEYEVEVLLGIATDTYDVLGKVVSVSSETNDEAFEEHLKSFVGKRSQPYPPYSSKTVGGEPLFALAKSGSLKDIEIPSKNIEIHSIKFLEKYSISAATLLKQITEDVYRVRGDFRQKEILELWNEVLTEHADKHFSILKIKVSCSSGTYMRSLAHELGEKLGIGASALRIKRTRVGEYC